MGGDLNRLLHWTLFFGARCFAVLMLFAAWRASWYAVTVFCGGLVLTLVIATTENYLAEPDEER